MPLKSSLFITCHNTVADFRHICMDGTPEFKDALRWQTGRKGMTLVKSWDGAYRFTQVGRIAEKG
jgi:hypothetical protein